MHILSLKTAYNTDMTIIPGIFIDQYMPHANGEFVKIYLYLLRNISSHNMNISISGMADEFSQTEADIMRALKYWDSIGVINLNSDKSDAGLTGVTLCDLYSISKNNSNMYSNDSSSSEPVFSQAEIPAPANSDTQPSAKENDSKTAVSSAKSKTPSHEDIKHTYSPHEISVFSEQEDFSLLLYAAGAYLGGTLSSTDASTITYFYDKLHFNADLIEYLIEYCVSRGHKSMRYIEKVALAWHDSGITTVSEAKINADNHSEVTYAVMKAFGISNRDLAQREREFISNWTEKMHFNTELITEACNRTMKAISNPSFDYANTILTKWHETGVSSMNDVAAADAIHQQSRQSSKTGSTSNGKNNKQNVSRNFSERDTDINSLEGSLISNN